MKGETVGFSVEDAMMTVIPAYLDWEQVEPSQLFALDPLSHLDHQVKRDFRRHRRLRPWQCRLLRPEVQLRLRVGGRLVRAVARIGSVRGSWGRSCRLGMVC